MKTKPSSDSSLTINVRAGLGDNAYDPLSSAEDAHLHPAQLEKGAALGSAEKPIATKVILNTLYVSLWIFLSGAVILYNKWILMYFGFPFPISLTMWHMAFSSVLATVCVKSGLVAADSNMTLEVYLRAVLPVALLFAGTLWLGNSAYMYLSVAFIQMLKALMPVAVFGTGCMFGVETFDTSTFVNMMVITTGVAIASYGEVRFVLLGMILQLLAVGTESTRLILVQILLQKRGLTLNPILTMYYIAPASFMFLSVLWVFLEKDALLVHHVPPSMAMILLSNGIVAFGLNLSVFLLIGKTSALAMNVAGVVKDWLLIGLSALIFHSQISGVSLGGYGLAFGGVCWYNHQKLQAMSTKQSIPLAPAKEDVCKDKTVSA